MIVKLLIVDSRCGLSNFLIQNGQDYLKPFRGHTFSIQNEKKKS